MNRARRGARPIDHVFFIVIPAADSLGEGRWPQPLENQGYANRAERIRTSDRTDWVPRIHSRGIRYEILLTQLQDFVEGIQR